MKFEILYMDGQCDRSIKRALSRKGNVQFARGLSEALELITRVDFDYFFVDADFEYAREFIIHLEHDPELITPFGVVLLTGNEEEDAEAWHVDTYINRDRVDEDIPYVFSHLRGRRDPPDNVLEIVRAGCEPSGDRPEREARGTTREKGVPFPAATSTTSSGSEVSGGESSGNGHRGDDGSYGPRRPGVRVMRAGLALAAVAAAVIWLFAWGPLGGGTRGPDEEAERQVEAGGAEVEEGAVFEYEDAETGPAETADREPAREVTGDTPATGTEAEGEESHEHGEEAPAKTAPAERQTAPEPVNQPPVVTISGPGQVMARQVVTYTANATDPEGDPLTYSWGGPARSMSWSSPGLYQVAVTVTDGRGASSGASLQVRVI